MAGERDADLRFYTKEGLIVRTQKRRERALRQRIQPGRLCVRARIGAWIS